MSALAIGTHVTTAYGKGNVVAYNEETSIYTIELSSWVLSGSSRVFVYAQNDKITSLAAEAAVDETEQKVSTPVPSEEAESAPAQSILTSKVYVQGTTTGTHVTTPYGKGKITAFDAHTGIYSIVFTEWVLSSNQTAHCYVTETGFKVDAEATPATDSAAPVAEAAPVAAAAAPAAAEEPKAEEVKAVEEKAEEATKTEEKKVEATKAEEKKDEATADKKEVKKGDEKKDDGNCGCVIA